MSPAQDKNSILVTKRLAELMLSVYTSNSSSGKKPLKLLGSVVKSIIRDSGVKGVPHEITDSIKV